MNRNNVGNIILFVVLSVAIFGGWWVVDTYFLPKPPPPPPPEVKTPKPARETVLALTGGGVTRSTELAEWKSNFKPEVQPKPARETILALAGGAPTVAPDVWVWPSAFRPVDVTPHRLIDLGEEGYNLRVLLTNKGAGVQQVVLPPFDQASREGRPAKDAYGQRYPLELVPGYYRTVDRTTVREDGPHHYLKAGEVGKDIPAEVQLTQPSYVLLHYEHPDDPFPHPSSALATRKWDLTAERAVSEGGVDGREVVFETTLEAPYHIHIRKTFTLLKNEYHVRMKLEFTPTAERTAQSKREKLHYQIAGPRNVPIEGEWYASTLRNAMVGWKTPSKEARRDIQDAAHITTEHGGNKVEAAGNTFTYAAVVNQFFASALCIDPQQLQDRPGENVWAYVRPTREWEAHPPDLYPANTTQADFYADKPQLGDITVRVAANPIDPTADKPVEHKYWVYNGPTKVRLLKTLDLFGKDHEQYIPEPTLVDDKYIDALGLNSMTDAATPNWFGKFAEFIHWTDLVVWFTNRMHDILGWMHRVVPIWLVNILMLTVLVRLLLMIPSRRQQAGMMKMQEKMAAMKPELDKLQEKYKADPQRLNQEKTRLMLAHGVNPLSSMGGCFLMFAQMPVFLGLYYCLQESIFFRLHGTWSWWMPNLAAPDMLFSWSESIPFISTADQIGHSWYLGPFVNILPVIAVALMYLNFKISSPPPTDEQQEMQQKMMKFMMIFMGVFFYKMAAGLCVYFICSTLWGLTERWLLKRKKKAMADDPLAMPGPSLVTSANKPAGPPKPPGFLEKVKQGLLEKLEEAQKQAEAKGQTIVNNPQQKPPQGGPPAPGTNGTGKRKKKKRK